MISLLRTLAPPRHSQAPEGPAVTSEVTITALPEVLHSPLPQSRCLDPPALPAEPLPDLTEWFRALDGALAPDAGTSPVMPMGFGGSVSVDDAAWLGDKALGIAVAEVLMANGIRGRDDLTRRHSMLVSNANLARRANSHYTTRVVRMCGVGLC